MGELEGMGWDGAEKYLGEGYNPVDLIADLSTNNQQDYDGTNQ